MYKERCPYPDYSKMSLREELEARFDQLEAEEAKRKKEQCQIPQPDYSKMSLHEELEARFAELDRQEQAANQTTINQPQKLFQQEPSIWDRIKSTAAPIAVGAKGFAQGAYTAGQDMINQLYQGGQAFGESIAGLTGENYKYYIEPINKYSDNWGNESEKMLNNFIQSKYTSYPRKYQKYPILAPVHDLYRNYKAMEDSGIIGADRFFHCAGAYDATKHGFLGEKIGQVANFIREIPFGVIPYGVEDSATDWGADEKGRLGAKQGLSLMEACPRNPRAYLR